MIPDYTIVLGVDANHLKQLSITMPTWRRHKPSLMLVPMIVFYDKEQVTERDVLAIVNHKKITTVPWPPEGVYYSQGIGDKWTNQQRHKMLAGFVHVAAEHVRTKYWLKIDTDVVATGHDDWISPEWFASDPAIVSHAWNFTRPADMIDKLDRWVSDCKIKPLVRKRPLNLSPLPGADRVGHRRIISWCGFFDTELTRKCAAMASLTCGAYQLPIPSQDTFMWYVAKRLGMNITRTNLKQRGWQQWATYSNVVKYAKLAMEN